MDKRYQVFISYRRDGGESTAKILRDKLTELGYRVFFDVESLRSGNFNTKLYSVIDECDDFLLILSPNALDRCQNEDDWVRLEIQRALSQEKNIVPVMLRGFSFPKELPESLEAIRYKNGIESNYQFFDAFIEKLVSFLISKPAAEKHRRFSGIYMWLILTAAAVAVLAAAGVIMSRRDRVYPRTQTEQNVTSDLLYYVQMNMLQLEEAAEHMDQAYLACDQYLSHENTSDRNALLATLSQKRRLLNQMDLDMSRMSDNLSDNLVDSPFSAADAAALHDYLETFCGSCIDNIYYMEFLTDKEHYMDQRIREETLDNYREILNEELKAAACDTNSLLLPITDEKALEYFKHEFLPQLYYIPLQASDWSTDQAALNSAADKSWNAIEKIMNRITVEVGESNMELMEEKAELIQEYMDQGMSAEESERMAEEFSGDSLLLTEKEAELQDMNKELDQKLDEARLKFAPSPEDDEGILWGKMLRFLNLGLYEDAIRCVDVYREKVRETDEYAEIYCSAAIRFIRNIGTTGIDYGLIVSGFELGEGEEGPYRLGDVIIAVEGSPCHNFEEYSALKSSASQGESLDVVVMREDPESGSEALQHVKLSVPADTPRVVLLEMSEKEYH